MLRRIRHTTTAANPPALGYTPLTHMRHWRTVRPMARVDPFEQLLHNARRMRRRRLERLERLARLAGLSPPSCKPADELDVRAIRAVTGLSQAKFAELLSIEAATLRNWEQGRREPTGPARALLRAIRNNPVAVIKALSD
jgi:putative transcriptional regulator